MTLGASCTTHLSVKTYTPASLGGAKRNHPLCNILALFLIGGTKYVDVDMMALWIVIGLMIIVVLAIFFVVWCICSAASRADRWSERYWDETENSSRKFKN